MLLEELHALLRRRLSLVMLKSHAQLIVLWELGAYGEIALSHVVEVHELELGLFQYNQPLEVPYVQLQPNLKLAIFKNALSIV